MKLIYYICLLFFIISCDNSLSSPKYANPLDPSGEAYIPPETIISNYDSLHESIIDTNSVTILLQGNDFVVEYAYSLNESGWSAWSPNTSVTLNNLLNGTYILNVKGRNAIHTEDETPATVTFTVECFFITDIDGNTYEIVKIGEQWWMAENLKVTHYNDGSEITHITNNGDWGGYTGEAQYTVYDNYPSNADIYGNLYNWYAVVDDRGICPERWHVPSDWEFIELEMHIGMSDEDAHSTGWRGTDEGSRMAGNGTLWTDGALEQDSGFGFSNFMMIPGGHRNLNSSFAYKSSRAYFWTSTDYGTNSMYRYIENTNTTIKRSNQNPDSGYSIRCLGD